MKSKAKFDWSAWCQEFQLRNLKTIVVIYAIFFIGSESLNEMYYLWVIKPVLKNIRESTITDFSIIVLLLTGAWHFLKQLRTGLIPTINALINCLLIFCIYYFGYRSNETYTFSKLTFCCFIAYADVAMLAVFLRLSSYKTYKKIEENSTSRFSMLDDSPSITQYEDAFNRKGYADHLVNHIFSTSSSTAFTIGIVGSWGAGKSDFINRIKEGMMWNRQKSTSYNPTQIKNIKNTICFDFNPWRVNKSESILEEFFLALSRELRPFNQSISNKVKDYSKKLLQPSKELHFRFLDTLIGEWHKDETIEEQYKSINLAIKLSGKRIVIFIDDMDRLSGREIIEVLRIVRNSANFGNVFFIIGFDYRYISKAIESSKDIENVDEYLKKFFQLQIALPVFRKSVLVTQIRSQLINDSFSYDEKRELETVLNNLIYSTDSTRIDPGEEEAGIVEAMLDNIRDVKRFINSFRLAYNVIGKEVDIYDLFVLELIKNKNINIFQKLRDKSFLEFDNNFSINYSLNTAALKKFYEKNPSDENITIVQSIKYLLDGHSQKKKEVVFRNRANFYRYFAYQIFDQISFYEYTDLWTKDSKEIALKFDEWIGEKKESELIRVSQERDFFDNKAYLEKVVLVYLLTNSENDFWMDYVLRLVYTNRKSNKELYFNDNPEEYKSFLIDIFENNEIPLFRRARIAHRFLVDFAQNKEQESDIELDRDYLLNMVYKLFDTYLDSSSLDNYNELISFFYLNDEARTDDNRVILSKKATERFRDKLISDESTLRLYLTYISRPSQIPYNGNIVFEPMFGQIFPEHDDAENTIEKLTPLDTSEERVLSFIKSKLAHYYSTNNAPFPLPSTAEGQLVFELMVKHKIVREFQ